MKPRVSAGATVTAAVLEIVFELVLPVLAPLVLLVLFAIVGEFPWDISRSAASSVLLYLPIALAVVLIVLASAPVTGVYLRSKGAGAAT
jgi:hypothetical protein